MYWVDSDELHDSWLMCRYWLIVHYTEKGMEAVGKGGVDMGIAGST